MWREVWEACEGQEESKENELERLYETNEAKYSGITIHEFLTSKKMESSQLNLFESLEYSDIKFMIKQELLPDVDLLEVVESKLELIGQSDTLYLVISLIRYRTEAGRLERADENLTKALYSLISKIDLEHILDQNKIIFQLNNLVEGHLEFQDMIHMFKISFLDQEEQIIKSELLTFISEVTEE